jgi:S1-C subfamily serine protease
MKRTLTFVVAAWFLSFSASAQNVLTRKEVYRVNCNAVVQIYVNDNFSGTGFIVSADGIVMTANHVVTTRESRFRQYASNIKVAVIRSGQVSPYPARPVNAAISEDQVNYDSAVLKIDASNLPHVVLGEWGEIDVGDSLTIIASFPQLGCIMLEGTVSNRSLALNGLGPKPVKTAIFQSPVRGGFSGSPIFSSKGHVVGIEDTKVFGISPALDDLRSKWMATRSHGSVQIMGIDVSGSFLELINNLDQNLISGLGSGVAIEYAKEIQQQAAKQNK